jgi:hypothetical protein
VSQKKLIHLIFKWITKVSVFFDSPCSAFFHFVGLYNDDNLINQECLRFCFMPVLRDELYSITSYWNTHSIRQVNNSESPAGRPDQLYFIPRKPGLHMFTRRIWPDPWGCWRAVLLPGIRMGLLSRIPRASKYIYVGRKLDNAKKRARSEHLYVCLLLLIEHF